MSKKNKYGLFAMIRKAIKETISNYKEHQAEIKEKRKFNFASNYDWLLLENLIKQVNDNPMLKVIIKKPDGTTINIATYHEQEKKSIDNLLNEVTFEEI